MTMPARRAEATLYKTHGYYRRAAGFAIGVCGQVAPAVLKGTTCSVHDSDCASGFSKLFCPGFDADSCVETGECCTPPRPPTGGGGGGGLINCGTHSCLPNKPCCGAGCCPVGSHCCGGEGCCSNDRTCRSIFGHRFCSPI